MDTFFNVFLSVGLTALVLLFFLHDLRSTLIVVIAMPFSLIGTFWIMRMLGLSFNILSLMGLATATGVLVSDSVIVLENIFRHKALGAGKSESASKGSREVMVAVVAATLTHVAVFVPMANMAGVMGRTMGDFAYTIVAATLFSLLMCFTLTPMMASRMLPEKVKEPGRFGRLLEGMFASWERGYGRAVRVVTANKLRSAIVVAASLAALVGSVSLSRALKFELLPSTDGGKVQILAELPLGSGITETGRVLGEIESHLKDYQGGFQHPHGSRLPVRSGQGRQPRQDGRAARAQGKEGNEQQCNRRLVHRKTLRHPWRGDQSDADQRDQPRRHGIAHQFLPPGQGQ